VPVADPARLALTLLHGSESLPGGSPMRDSVPMRTRHRFRMK
jgi:hypothetical protein